MTKRPRSPPGDPMTLGNMRADGVRSLAVSCHLCHHAAVLSADPWPDDVPVPSFVARLVCTRCGIVAMRELSTPPQGWHWAAIALLVIPESFVEIFLRISCHVGD
jgi:hypothetical protein